MPGDAGAIRVGIGGWTYEPWRGVFYPKGLAQKRELEFASRALTSIEVNGTFYGSQKPESFARWHDEAPEGFVFALKGPRFATNRRLLAGAGESIERFLTSGVTGLKAKLGPINWQLPPTKAFDAADFEGFLKLLPARHDGLALRHAVEARHPSFAVPEVVAMARAHGVAMVVAGDSGHPLIPDPTAPFVYARIMGTVDGEPHGYSGAALGLWAGRARAWATGERADGLPLLGGGAPHDERREVFLYVISGFKQANPHAAMGIIERLGAGG